MNNHTDVAKTTEISGVAFRQRGVCCASPTGLHHMAYNEWGDHDNPKVLVCVHGLTRNARDFDQLARVLAGNYRVICPDIVGRGRSDWLRDPTGYTIPQYLHDMLVLIARLDVETVHWVGTSMGGLIGMALASLENTPITRLVLNDIGPVIPSESIKRIGDYVGRAPSFDTYDAAENYIRIVSAPFGALNDDQWRQLTESSLRQNADGRLEMRYDPGIGESFRREMSGGDIDLWPVFDRVGCPTLVVRGAESDLLKAETLQAMASRGPHPAVVEVPGVGHAPMFLDEAQISIVRDFLLAA